MFRGANKELPRASAAQRQIEAPNSVREKPEFGATPDAVCLPLDPFEPAAFFDQILCQGMTFMTFVVALLICSCAAVFLAYAFDAYQAG